MFVYTEGEVTEPIYFRGVRSALRAQGIEFGHRRGNPLQLLKYALKEARRLGYDAKKGDSIWCVFDVECPKPHAQLPEAFAFAAKHDVRLAVSNPCFELWLVLHFRAHASHVDNDAIGRILERHLRGYTRKNKRYDYGDVVNGYAEALSRARDLERRHQPDTPRWQMNPTTTAGELVDAMHEFTRANRPGRRR